MIGICFCGVPIGNLQATSMTARLPVPARQTGQPALKGLKRLPKRAGWLRIANLGRRVTDKALLGQSRQKLPDVIV